MIKYAILLSLMSTAPAMSREAACTRFDGAVLLNEDDEFIGVLGGEHDAKSIFNKYGTYGSKYNGESIWNPYGKNGSEYQTGSAFNPYTSTPPRIVKDRQVIGYLSANKNLTGAVSPLTLAVLCYGYEPN